LNALVIESTGVIEMELLVFVHPYCIKWLCL